MIKVIAFSLFFCCHVFAQQYPPTTSKGSADSSGVVTFNYLFPNFTGTHTGQNFSLGVNSVAGGGTGSSSYTSGSIPFSNGSILTQDNSKIYWNDTNYYLGISTSAPDSPLTINTSGTTLPAYNTGAAPSIHLGSAVGSGTYILEDAWSNTPQFNTRRADGSPASPSAVQANDIMANIVFTGYGATSYQTMGAAKIVATAAENFTDTTGAAILQFYTRPSGTIASSSERVRINQNGYVGVNTTSPLNLLDVNGSAAIGAYAGTSTAPTNGLIVSGNVGVGTAAPAQAIDTGTTGIIRTASIVGSTSIPTVTYGAAAGTGAATVAIIGTQVSGYLQFTTGTATTTGTVLTLTAPVTCPNYWFLVLQPNNAAFAAASSRIYSGGATPTTFNLSVATLALTASTAYSFNWVAACD